MGAEVWGTGLPRGTEAVGEPWRDGRGGGRAGRKAGRREGRGAGAARSPGSFLAGWGQHPGMSRHPPAPAAPSSPQQPPARPRSYLQRPPRPGTLPPDQGFLFSPALSTCASTRPRLTSQRPGPAARHRPPTDTQRGTPSPPWTRGGGSSLVPAQPRGAGPPKPTSHDPPEVVMGSFPQCTGVTPGADGPRGGTGTRSPGVSWGCRSHRPPAHAVGIPNPRVWALGWGSPGTPKVGAGRVPWWEGDVPIVP